MGKAVEITDSNFSEIVNEGVVLVDFWAEWCGPCRMIAPMIEELASEYEGKATIGKLDVDNNQESSVKFGVRSIPTLLIFKDGELIDRHVGAVGKETLSNSIDSNLS
ncbi:MAG: thioredoxin [Cytophagales bacterium]